MRKFFNSDIATHLCIAKNYIKLLLKIVYKRGNLYVICKYVYIRVCLLYIPL